ncbi:C40 family peptidase [Micromonospora globbae]|uniref:C40 family peptidase n=1 Tax=Micromonospora globbae TaxID=1894969 RepID=UPI00341ED3BC
MSGKAVAGLTGIIVTLVMGCVAALGLAGGGLAIAACAAPMTTPSPGGTTLPDSGWPAVGSWSSEQVGNAATIVAVGQQLHVPPRGWVIAVATAMQESSLHNLGDLGPNNDHDSLGLFQQRPSQGWGTPTQILDPVYAATQFYNHLLAVPNWQDLPLTVAAQTVQRSATPTAYAKWEHDAFALVNHVGPAMSGALPADFTQWLSTCTALGGDGHPGSDSVPLPPGFTLPPNTPPAIVTAIRWALAQLGTPYAFGGDCTDAHSGSAAHQCDCSSLIQGAYRAAGISLPRTTDGQQHAGTAVTSLTDILPGDLIFIPGSDGTMSDPGHVGLYIGQGLLVQAPHAGDVVKISKVSAWANQIAKIRRIIEA